jgi:hypothetical protein
MSDRSPANLNTAVGPDGRPLTLADLPPAGWFEKPLARGGVS